MKDFVQSLGGVLLGENNENKTGGGKGRGK